MGSSLGQEALVLGLGKSANDMREILPLANTWRMLGSWTGRSSSAIGVPGRQTARATPSTSRATGVSFAAES
jgi:hypothetical protein